jgi:beta-glucosidase
MPSTAPRVRGARASLVSSIAAALLAALLLPGVGRAQILPFRDPAVPLPARIDDLVGRLTLDEKIRFLHQYQAPVPRLGIALFKNGTEALHGVAWSNDDRNNGAVVTATATVFPQALGLASTWDTDLVRRVGAVVGTEARGLNAQDPVVWGLNLWAPVVNLLRDPRWGRNEEGYSEDPLLTGAISVAYSSGLAGDDPRYLRTAPTLKHFLAYNNEVRRDVTSSNVSPRVLWEYDLRAFQPAIAAGFATGVMPAYNLVDGRPLHVSPMLDEVVRSWTKNDLMVVSDAWAPYNLTGSEQYYATQPEADAAAIRAGLDSFTQDDNRNGPLVEAIQAALAAGYLAEADVDRAVRHVLSVRFRLGEFDPPGLNPYAAITPAVVNAPAHGQLARETAAKAMVLLVNERRTLPLEAARVRKVAVVGPLANTLYTDWYGGNLPYRVTPVQGIAERLGAGAEVVWTEAVDRIALQDVASGRWVTASTAPSGAVLTASATAAGTEQAFDVFDWGEGIVTLRAAANGKTVQRSWDGGVLVNSEAQPNGWFVMQQFKLLPQADGTFVLEYAGYEVRESWYDGKRFVVVGPDGRLAVTATTADAASRFTRAVLTSGVAAAAEAARGADAVVAVVGSMPFINGRENADRASLELAAGQAAMVRAVVAVNPRTVLVLENSYPTAIGWEKDHVPAIVWTTHAGQETGHALADVLFGDRPPAGRLTQTWYRSTADLPDILDYDIISNGATYLYFEGEPLFPFGHGLTYSSFEYRNLRLGERVIGPKGAVDVTVEVVNTGRRAGDEVVQLYTRQLVSRVKQPLQSLRGFQRIHLEPGRSTTVRFRVRAEDLAFWDVTRSRPVVEASLHEIRVGRSAGDIRASAKLAVLGEVIPPRDLGRLTRAETYDAHGGTTLVDESKVQGTAVGSVAAGDWIAFQKVGASPGVGGFTVRVAREAAGGARLAVRLDDPVTGPLLATVQVPSTGSRYAYVDVTAPATGFHGIRDVYLVFDEPGTRVSTFRLTSTGP